VLAPLNRPCMPHSAARPIRFSAAKSAPESAAEPAAIESQPALRTAGVPHTVQHPCIGPQPFSQRNWVSWPALRSPIAPTRDNMPLITHKLT
jgi:hypothetical protein